MYQLCLGLLLAVVPLAATAQTVPPGYPTSYARIIEAARKEGKLLIYSGTDLAVANPLLRDFRAMYPGINVDYRHVPSAELYKQFISESKEDGRSADVLWSPAMNLQMKLVNDGYAQTYRSQETVKLPEWAVWRDEAYGTTFEPAVFVYNKRLLNPKEVPQTHTQLAQLLTKEAARFKDKVTTYDIERTGSGFLLATQDSMTSPAFWDLARAMFATGYHPHSTTSTMLERIASGEFLIGYNLLGSYVIALTKTDPSIGYVLPKDYTLVMSRIVFITRSASNPNAARLWVDYLLSQRGQRIIANESDLFSLRSDVEGEATAARLAQILGNSIKPITVGPGLLTHLDQAKRLEFIKKWQKAGGNE